MSDEHRSHGVFSTFRLVRRLHLCPRLPPVPGVLKLAHLASPRDLFLAPPQGPFLPGVKGGLESGAPSTRKDSIAARSKDARSLCRLVPLPEDAVAEFCHASRRVNSQAGERGRSAERRPTFELDGALRVCENETLLGTDGCSCPTGKAEPDRRAEMFGSAFGHASFWAVLEAESGASSSTSGISSSKQTDLATLASDHFAASRSRSLWEITFSIHTWSVTAASRCTRRHKKARMREAVSSSLFDLLKKETRGGHGSRLARSCLRRNRTTSSRSSRFRCV